MTKIKLPWRRFGDERPECNTNVLLCVVSHPCGRDVDSDKKFTLLDTCLLPLDPFGVGRGAFPPMWSNRGVYWPATPDDRWIYLSEIKNPFEEGEE